MKPLVHEHPYLLTAAECDARGRLPLTLLVERIIETATEHANRLGIGYVELSRHGIGWVLSRLSVDLDRMPEMNSHYLLRTYINDLNRLYSTRTHQIIVERPDGTQHLVGQVRTVWVAINVDSRTPADLSVLDADDCVRPDSPCPVAPLRRIGNPVEDAVFYRDQYTFRYTDIDINGHVNSVRYLDSILECRSLEWHREHRIVRFDIIYQHECLWHQTVAVTASTKTLQPSDNEQPPQQVDEIVLDRDGDRVVAARITWQ